MARLRKIPDGCFIVPDIRYRPRLSFGGEVQDCLTEKFYWALIVSSNEVGTIFDVEMKRRLNLPHCPDIGEGYAHGPDAMVRCCDAGLRTAFDELFNETQLQLNAAYAEGQVNGRSLLIQMAKGKITADDAHGLVKPKNSDES